MSNLQPTQEELYGLVFGLTMGCPFECGNPELCFLYDLRQKSVRDRKQYIDNLSAGQLQALYAQHRDCCSEKEGRAAC